MLEICHHEENDWRKIFNLISNIESQYHCLVVIN